MSNRKRSIPDGEVEVGEDALNGNGILNDVNVEKYSRLGSGSSIEFDMDGEEAMEVELPVVVAKTEVKQQMKEIDEEDNGSYYEILNSNEFADESLNPDDVKSKLQFWCSCPPPPKGEIGCLTGCENREKRVECDATLCKAGENCGNRAIQLKGDDKIALTEEFGGTKLVATGEIEAGSYLAQYTGQLVTRDDLEDRLAKLYRPEQRIHVLPLNKVWVVDATTKGSIARLATHSCAPNVSVEVWLVDGMDCLGMFSIRNLKANENITFDHSQQLELLGACKRCSCGARSCKKLLGGTAHCDSSLACTLCQGKCGAEGRVFLHPALAVPCCQQCKLAWCNTDFSQMTSNGKEALCRWCGKQGGGKVVNCVLCPATFCKKCLKVNLGPNYIKLAETGSWTCLMCDTRPLDKLRGQLLADGEQRKKPLKPPASANVPSGPQAGFGKSPSRLPGVQQARAPGQGPGGRPPPQAQHSNRQPGGISRPRYPVPPPRTGAMPRTPTALPRPQPRQSLPRLVGQTNVTIERVARPAVAPTPPKPSPQSSAIINQLQRYSGLSIKPVSVSVSQLEELLKEVKEAQRMLQDAVYEAEKGKSEDKVSKAKDKLAEDLSAVRTRLSQIERKF